MRGRRDRGDSGEHGRPRPWDSQRGVDTPVRWLKSPVGPEAIVYIGECESGFDDGGAGVRESRQRLTRSDRWSRRSTSPTKSSVIEESAGHVRRWNQGCATVGGYGQNRSESGVGRSQNPPVAATALGSGEGGRNTRGLISPRKKNDR